MPLREQDGGGKTTWRMGCIDDRDVRDTVLPITYEACKNNISDTVWKKKWSDQRQRVPRQKSSPQPLCSERERGQVAAINK